MKYSLLIFSLLFFSKIVSSQISISEYSASNLNQFIDDHFNYEDWIEIYNESNVPIDLGGYFLSDKETKPTKWQFPDGSIIGANGYLTIWCSGRDTVTDRGYHTNFKLTQTKDDEFVILISPSEDVIESHLLELTLLGHSRIKNDQGGWDINTTPIPGEEDIVGNIFQSYSDQPVIEQEAGFYNDSVRVEIINPSGIGTLVFTLNGREPDANSQVYTEPILIEKTTVVKASILPDSNTDLQGKMAYATYFINEEFSLPVVSIAAFRLQDLANGNGDLRPIGSIEYFKDNVRTSHSYGELNRHGQDSWINDQRSLDWISRDEMGYSKALNEKLFTYSDRDEYQRFMLRASGDDNYPAVDDLEHEGSTHMRDEYVHVLAQNANMKLDIRAVERAIVFLNGDYWGVYSPRERPVDHDYTDYTYDQDKYNLQFVLTWGDTWNEYGGQKAFDDWIALRDSVLDSDLSIQENYEYLKDNMQMQSMIDYMLINLNTVCSDWINYNTGWWRGLDPDGGHKKWGYVLWDNDATFDYFINYSGVPNTDPDATPCDLEGISQYMDVFFDGHYGEDNLDSCSSSPYPEDDPIYQQVITQDLFCCSDGWDEGCQELYDLTESGYINEDNLRLNGNVGKHEKIFLKLIEENDEFRQLYYSRQADLMNTTFSCESMTSILDSLVAIIEPEMPRHIERWGGSMAEWEANLNKLRDFVEERCELFDDGMTTCYDLSGPYNLTLEVFPEGAGDIDLNTIEVKSFPWTGQYFGDMENLIDADPGPDYDFVRWEVKNGSAIAPDEFSENASITLMDGDTLVAIFELETTSTIEIDEDIFDLNVYPSPTNDLINIDFNLQEKGDIKITLLNTLGQQIHSIKTTGRSNANQFKMSAKELQLATGSYIVQLNLGDSQVHRKITVIE